MAINGRVSGSHLLYVLEIVLQSLRNKSLSLELAPSNVSALTSTDDQLRDDTQNLNEQMKKDAALAAARAASRSKILDVNKK